MITPEQARLQQALRPLVLKTMDSEAPYELAKAFLRYEHVRKLHVNQFQSLSFASIRANIPFDQLVDEAILAATKPA